MMCPTSVVEKHDLIRNWLLGALLVVSLMAILAIGSTVFIPIFMAFFLSAVLAPFVGVLMRAHIPRGVAAVAVVLAFCVGVFMICSIIYAPALEWRDRIPELADRLQSQLQPIRETLEEVQESAEQIGQATEIGLKDEVQVAAQQEPPFFSRLLEQARVLLGQIVATIILTLFLLASKQPFLSGRVLASFGNTGRKLRKSIEEAGRQMTRYISTVSMINSGVGLCAGAVVYAAGFDNPLLWIVAVALLSFIPFVGPLVSTIAVGAAAFLTQDSLWDALLPVVAFVLIHFTEGQLVTPMILGRTMTLSPVAILISLLIWGWIWGLAGAFLAVPILLTCLITTRKVLLSPRS